MVAVETRVFAKTSSTHAAKPQEVLEPILRTAGLSIRGSQIARADHSDEATRALFNPLKLLLIKHPWSPKP